MPEKGWKQFERRVANRLGGKRIPVTGERGGSDVKVGDVLRVQCKLGRSMPSYLRQWLGAIVDRAAEVGPGCTGVVVWKPNRALDDEALVIMRMRDFEDLHGR